jgi:hypothetical protein
VIDVYIPPVSLLISLKSSSISYYLLCGIYWRVSGSTRTSDCGSVESLLGMNECKSRYDESKEGPKNLRLLLRCTRQSPTLFMGECLDSLPTARDVVKCVQNCKGKGETDTR